MPTTKYDLGQSLTFSTSFEVKLLPNFMINEAATPLKFGDKEP